MQADTVNDMVMATRNQGPMLDLDAPAYFDDPYAHYASLRDCAPVHRDPRGPWMVFRDDDVRFAVRHLSSRLANAPDTERTRRLVRAWGDGILTHPHLSRSDPPDHTRLRRVVARAFTPRMAEDLRPRIRAVLDDLLQPMTDGGPVELLSHLAHPLPYQVMCSLLGYPTGRNDELLLECTHAFVTATMEPFLTDAQMATVVEANRVLTAQITEAVEWKRRNLGDDIISLLLGAEDGRAALTPAEVVDQVRLLFAAGHETTVNSIGNAVAALLRHPDQWARLVESPDRVGHAVEELLRYDNTIQIAWRTTAADVEIGGVAIPAGNDVIAWIGSANRDPRRWGPTADQLDIARAGADGHVSFGAGPHLCLGAALARTETQEVLRALATRFPGTRLVAEDLRWRPQVGVRGLFELPLELKP